MERNFLRRIRNGNGSLPLRSGFMSPPGAITVAWWDPPRLAPQIVQDRYSSKCRVARAGWALRAHDASPEPMGSIGPIMGLGATVGPVGTGVWRAHSPQASHAGQSDEMTKDQASPPGGTLERQFPSRA